MAAEGMDAKKSMIQDLMGAMIDKHGQLDVQLRNLSVQLAGSRLGVEVSGLVTVSVHMRDLDEREKRAHVEDTIARLRP
ncbi:MAG: hypothetical protein WCA77_10345 [Thermoplasmata archaeon]